MLLLGDGFVAVGLLILAGMVGFFVMAVALALRLGGFMMRTLFGGTDATAPKRSVYLPAGNQHICPHRRCGHLNQRSARFCARCGRPLRGGGGTDAYA